jgi:hypothetical protein
MEYRGGAVQRFDTMWKMVGRDRCRPPGAKRKALLLESKLAQGAIDKALAPKNLRLPPGKKETHEAHR